MNSEGICGLMMLFKYVARWYSAVFIIKTTGLNGRPGLWDLQKPYNFQNCSKIVPKILPY